MPFNGAGSYTPPGTDFPAVALTLIESTKFNNVINDIATALSTCITKNGQTTILANLPMAGFRHTGVGNGAARSDYAAMGQVQDGTPVWGGTAGGTANALTFALTPAIAAYLTGQAFRFKAAATNTGAGTVAINGLAAKAIQANGGALIGGEILLGGLYEIVYDGAAFQLDAVTVPAWSTGDVKLTYKTTADVGWIMVTDGTIGSAASGATRANADTEALYTLLWNNTANAQCAVSTGRGANAAADFAANKTLAIPKSLGRALAVSGAGAGLTARALALAVGAESKTVAAANLPASGLSIPSLSLTGTLTSLGIRTASANAGGSTLWDISTSVNLADTTTPAIVASGPVSGSTGTGTTGNMGSGTALDVMNPMQYLNVMLKL